MHYHFHLITPHPAEENGAHFAAYFSTHHNTGKKKLENGFTISLKKKLKTY